MDTETTVLALAELIDAKNAGALDDEQFEASLQQLMGGGGEDDEAD